MSTEMDERLALALREVPEILAAWLFGSSLRGKDSRRSDVDVAVLLDVAPDVKTIGAILAACQDALAREDVDLVVLNSASPILAFEAISGRRLFSADPDATTTFEARVAREYEDESARFARASRLPRS